MMKKYTFGKTGGESRFFTCFLLCAKVAALSVGRVSRTELHSKKFEMSVREGITDKTAFKIVHNVHEMMHLVLSSRQY
ncbi:hypothetical protein DTX80_11355 [Bacilli bacterium]|nr:hypothetical protein WH51_11395 [Bacilli bacterium VT-13-104]PZD83714.1 hypothetical protein DEJ64_13825 [Bacilli bacterium]PZD84903.1 hypothetical protein DEJ60_13495 [Bacilli bacterium]PZD87230.1 hypothetical protein DEJ66_14185 [Bacilli bacterium]RCO05432.1 hypothetical protein DTX80_11355 [Bacilli bacterium]